MALSPKLENRKKDWLAQLTRLFNDIEKWAKANRWQVDRHGVSLHEQALGDYQTEELLIRTPQGRLIVTPIGCDVSEADGRVDIEAYPSLRRMVLLLHGNHWTLNTDQYLEWPEPWGESSFSQISQRLTA